MEPHRQQSSDAQAANSDNNTLFDNSLRHGVQNTADPDHSQAPRPKHHRPGHWRRVISGILLILLAAVIIYIVYIAQSVAKISTQPLELGGLTADSSGRVNVLVLGVGDPGHAGEDLSDTIMVLSLNTQTKKIAQISVPRDLRVDIPDHGTAKINAADADGGVPLAEQTVSNTLGIPINYYVQTDFTGLSKLVDAVGGLDINVQQSLVDPEYPCADNQYAVCGVDIQPGLQHMNGARVLEYVRCRKGTCGNDFGRAARQQEVINLIRQKILSPAVLLNPSKLDPVINAARTGIQTDMGAVQMAEFFGYWNAAHKNQPINAVFSTSPGGYLTGAPGSSDLVPIGGNFNQIQNYVQNIFTAPPIPPTP